MRVLTKMKKPKATRILGGALGLLLVLTLVLMPVPALAMPQMGHVFYGDVTSGEGPASEGVSVVAKIGGETYASTTVDAEGRYGWEPAFEVPADDPDTGDKEGGVNGETVEFYVAGVLADTYAFEIGGRTELDLTAGEAPAVAIDAVTTPTNVATQTLTGTMSVGLTVVLTADTAATFGAVSYPTSTTWSCDVTLVEGSNGITATADTSTATATIVLDTTSPTVEITSTASDPTNTSPIPMTATFSEDVTGFVVGDITVGNGTAGNFVAVSGAVYTFRVTPTADGEVTVDIAAGVAQDAAGNPNEAATQFSITYDGTAPTATVSPAADATGVALVAAVTATFGEDVLERALGDITITGATGVSATLSEATDTITIAHDAFALDTNYTVTIPAGAVDDLAGNPSAEISWSFTTMGVVVLESISALPISVNLDDIGVTQAITVTATYDDASTADVTTSADCTYVSNVPAVATVTSPGGGLITAVAKGSATITVSYTEGGITETDTVLVTVEFDPMDYDDNDNGVIDKSEALEAVDDFFALLITKAQALEVIVLYFA